MLQEQIQAVKQQLQFFSSFYKEARIMVQFLEREVNLRAEFLCGYTTACFYAKGRDLREKVKMNGDEEGGVEITINGNS